MKTLALRDIIGPIMVGPSSSHTAGALRIAAMARRLCGSRPTKVHFTLYGSFAHTGTGHGTDKALVAGILGLSTDDLDIRRSFELAQEQDVEVDFTFDTTTQTDHPNTVDIHIQEESETSLSVRGVSIGGGAAVISRIDGIDVDITGEHTSVVVRQHDEPGVLAHIATALATHGVNIATTRMYRAARGGAAYTVMETDDAVPFEVQSAIESSPSVYDVRIIPAAALEDTTTECENNTESVQSLFVGKGEGSAKQTVTAKSSAAEREEAYQNFMTWNFTKGSELISLCRQKNLSISQAFLEREQALAQFEGRNACVNDYLEQVLEVMSEAVHDPLRNPTPSTGGLIGGEAQKLQEAPTRILDSLSAHVSAYALAALETNAAMGRIVAAPTAGSSGVIPAVLFALAQEKSLPPDSLKKGLLTAAAVGYLIAHNASVSGAEGGCQAEVGAAAGMAAAAVVEMMGGTPSQALAAAANALSCLMGLVCDPVGGLVELPCQKRNATAANTALVCAQIALSGVTNLISFDETVEALDAVGKSLPFELRESALGGLAATPSACQFCGSCG